MKKTLVAVIAVGLFVTAPVIAQTMMESGEMGSGMMNEQQQRMPEPDQEYLKHMQEKIQANMMNSGYGMMGGYGNMPMMGWGYGTPPCTTGGGYNMMNRSGMMPMMMGGYGMMPMMGGYGMMSGPGHMGGPGMMWGQNADDLKKYETFARETHDLRKKLHDLMFEYGEARWNPATTIGNLNKMAEEMNKLRQEIQEKMPK